MRRFRFVGDETQNSWAVTNPIKNEPYTIHQLRDMAAVDYLQESDIESWISMGIWQEVHENEGHVLTQIPEPSPNPLHKDTDLGMFSAMFVQELIKTSKTPDYHERIVSDSISLARELIKQLDEQGHEQSK